MIITPFAYMAEAAAVSYLLDDYPGAVGAYSLRKLSSTYLGSAIEVTRASDLTTQDIGFDANGDLDETALTTFVGASTGYVSKWYDQSGNSNDQAQASVGAMPWIVDTGTIVKQAGKVAIDFPGNDYFERSNIISNTADKTTFNVYYPTNVATSDCIMDLSAGGGTGRAWTLTSETALRCVSRTYVTTAGTSNTYSLLEMWQNGITIDDAAQFKMYLNGTYEARASGASGDLVTQTNNFNIGYSPNGSNYFDGTQQEVLIYSSSLSDTDREGVRDNINAYYSVY